MNACKFCGLDQEDILLHESRCEKRPAPLTSKNESLARAFHEVYERLAPSFGYETRKETRAFDPTTPNGRLMMAVCGELRDAEVERLQKREIQIAVALRAVRETVQKDSPQWLLANELLKILGGPSSPDETKAHISKDVWCAMGLDLHCTCRNCAIVTSQFTQETKPEPHPGGRMKCLYCHEGFVTWGDCNVHERSCSKNPALNGRTDGG